MSFLEENNGIYTTFCDIIVYNYRFCLTLHTNKYEFYGKARLQEQN